MRCVKGFEIGVSRCAAEFRCAIKDNRFFLTPAVICFAIREPQPPCLSGACALVALIEFFLYISYWVVLANALSSLDKQSGMNVSFCGLTIVDDIEQLKTM
jgi:hypothetical protein